MRDLVLVLIGLVAAFWYWGAHFAITILAISFLIFFHELGHFLVARLCGVAVNVFSIGFGKKIYARKIGQTQYCLSALPLGGYVQLKGQDDLRPDVVNMDADSYQAAGAIKRIAILFAGPFFNIILAFFIYIALGFIGVDKLSPVVGEIAPDSAAAHSGILKNDRILSINGDAVRQWDEIKKLINKHSGDGVGALNLKIMRDTSVINLVVTPKIGESRTIFGEKVMVPLIGIMPNGASETIYNYGLDSVKNAIFETVEASKLIIKGLEKLLTGVVPLKEMGGIVAMADITTKASQISLSLTLVIVALISVNLGILNLLPLPVLDGGHIIFNLYELIAGRPAPQRVFVALSYGGMGLLFGLMTLTIINDFLRLAGVYE